MTIDPNILRKIKEVVFLKNEPPRTDVLWGKYIKPDTYDFHFFFDGAWHPAGEITNVTISTFSGTISAFVNDVGYITFQDVSTSLDKKADKDDLAAVATTGSYNDLSDKPTIPTALSQLNEDTTHRVVSDTEKTTWNSKQDALVSGTNIKTINNQSILGSGNITIQGSGSSVQSDWNQTNTEADDYIKNKPIIPSKTSDLTNDSKFVSANSQTFTDAEKEQVRQNIGAAAGATAYQKPQGGIPKSDLAQGVQDSLALADTALQEDTLYVKVNNNGHEYVDLGLPSGTLWAKCNVGADAETGYGNYYMYGKGARQYNSSDSPYTGTEDPLDLSVDTARQVLGGSWKMPTQVQMQELIDNTTYEFTTINGVNGAKFTAQNGNYVFIPAAGYWDSGSQDNVGSSGNYWSSTPDDSDNAYNLLIRSSLKLMGTGFRISGFSVRGVIQREPSQLKKDLDSKADKVPNATNGNFAGLDANGNITDSGSKASDFATPQQLPTTMGASGSGHKGGLVPDTPSTAGTTKFLCEDGTWKAVDMSGKEDVTTIVAPVNETDETLPVTALNCEVGKYYRLDVPVETLAVTLPAITDSTTVRAVVFYLTTGATPAITFSSAVPVYYHEGFELDAGKTYEVNALFNGSAWVIASVEIVVTNGE